MRLKYDGPLSSFAYYFNLRHHIQVADPDDDPDDEDEPPRMLIEAFEKLPTPRELPTYYGGAVQVETA
jgi:hypothetical protein